jgi:hypothetical protein
MTIEQLAFQRGEEALAHGVVVGGRAGLMPPGRDQGPVCQPLLSRITRGERVKRCAPLERITIVSLKARQAAEVYM